MRNISEYFRQLFTTFHPLIELLCFYLNHPLYRFLEYVEDSLQSLSSTAEASCQLSNKRYYFLASPHTEHTVFFTETTCYTAELCSSPKMLQYCYTSKGSNLHSTVSMVFTKTISAHIHENVPLLLLSLRKEPPSFIPSSLSRRDRRDESRMAPSLKI